METRRQSRSSDSQADSFCKLQNRSVPSSECHPPGSFSNCFSVDPVTLQRRNGKPITAAVPKRWFYPDVSWNNAEDCLSGSRFIQFTSSRKHLTPALDSAALLRAEEGGTPMCLLPELPQPIFLQLGTWKKEPRTSLCFCFGPSW